MTGSGGASSRVLRRLLVDLAADAHGLPELQPGVVLQTVHGSRLYGLANGTSDYDFYFVVDQPIPRPVHNIRADVDVTIIDLHHFMVQVFRGVPQALEALYSASAHISEGWVPYLRSWRSAGPLVLGTFRRTQAAFRKGPVTDKRLVHARRLQITAAQIEAHGRFRPELTSTEAAWVRGATPEDMQTPPPLPEVIDPSAQH